MLDLGAVLRPHDAGVDPGQGAMQRGRVYSRTLQGLPANLQQQALLRFQGEGFTRRDTEEGRIEGRGIMQETTGAGGYLAEPSGLGIVELGGVPTAVGRVLADRVPLLHQQRPERFRAVGTTRITTAHADDGDGLVMVRARHDGCGLALAR